MTTFLLELWHDLREKRLWPVAVGLVAAIVAIPMVMLKPASGGSAQPVVVAKAPQPDTLPAVDVDTSPTHGSKLETFSQRNPFKPLSDLKKDDAGAPTTSSSSSSSSSSSTAGPSGGSSATGGSPLTGSPSTGSPSTPPSSTPSTPSTPSSPTVQWFRYVADIRFGEPGHMKDHKGLGDLTLLPDNQTAAIVFMGIVDAKSAVFFVADPAFTPDGEGECNDKKDCRFVQLSVDAKKNEETFTSLDGKTKYSLKLVKLRRETLSASDAQGDTSPKLGLPKLGKPAGGSIISEASDAVLPRLLDLSPVARSTK
jgi:hypothetical protein